MHQKVPAGFGGRLRGKGPHPPGKRNLAAQPILSSPASRELYLRHGYVLLPDGPIRLPDGGPEMWPMWRDPQVTTPAPEQPA